MVVRGTGIKKTSLNNGAGFSYRNSYRKISVFFGLNKTFCTAFRQICRAEKIRKPHKYKETPQPQGMRASFLIGGAEGSRTPVRKHFDRTFSGRSQVSAFPPRKDTGQTLRFSRVMMRGRGNSYPPHGRHLNDAFPGRWPLRFRRSLLKQRRQQYSCCQLSLICPFYGGQAPPPAYPASTPPSKPVQPRMGRRRGDTSPPV